MAMITLLLLCVVPYEPSNVKARTVDRVEFNHLYNENADLIFDQVIFYDWVEADERFQVRAWRLVKQAGHAPVRLPEGGFLSHFEENGAFYRVYAKARDESWTQYDPEVVEREYLPKEKRKEL
jgi:hypothetical protein